MHLQHTAMERKRLIDLTKADLLENEVWEYWMADNTEYVMASERTVLPEGGNVTYLVITDFYFNNRTKHVGFCSPHDAGTLDEVQSVVFVNKGQVEFYRENDWTDDEKKKALHKLGLASADVFPLTYKSRIKSGRELFTGTLLGFNESK
jgi:hypothetical protein